MRADEPRVTVRLSDEDYRVISAVAQAAGVKVAAVMREAARLYAAQVARESSLAGGRLPRRPVSRNPAPAASKSSPAERAGLANLHETVMSGREVMLARQAKLNKAKS